MRRAMGPGTSYDADSGSTPYVDTRPRVGRTALMPHAAAGMRSEPPVSVPVASGTIRAASAAADPPDEPPGVRARSHGLRVGCEPVP
jgi:hypothetical protein